MSTALTIFGYIIAKTHNMELKELLPRTFGASENKLELAFSKLEKLVVELRSRQLPGEIIEKINSEIELVNSSSNSDLKKQIRRSKANILKVLEKELKLVPQNYYRNMWLVLGMSAFGIPMGVAFGTALDNMGFLGIGLPIGMAIGIAVGSGMDKKAKEENRQLRTEL